MKKKPKLNTPHIIQRNLPRTCILMTIDIRNRRSTSNLKQNKTKSKSIEKKNTKKFKIKISARTRNTCKPQILQWNSPSTNIEFNLYTINIIKPHLITKRKNHNQHLIPNFRPPFYPSPKPICTQFKKSTRKKSFKVEYHKTLRCPLTVGEEVAAAAR